MITNLNIDLTTRYCPVEYKGQQWVKLYYTPRDEMKLYRIMKRQRAGTYDANWEVLKSAGELLVKYKGATYGQTS